MYDAEESSAKAIGDALGMRYDVARNILCALTGKVSYAHWGERPAEPVVRGVLPSREIQAKIVASYIRGTSTTDLALDFMLHERLVIRILVDSG